MYKDVRLSYILQRGDNIYRIAQLFQTTANKITTENKHINPNNLKAGDVITIVPGSIHCVESLHEKEISQKHLDLSNEMRLHWSQHVYWTRFTEISIFKSLPDLDFVIQRLLQNPKDISDIYKPYYSPEAVKTISKLLRDHLTIAASLFNALKNDNMEEFKILDAEWTKNADDMAKAFASVNPYYKEDEVREMLYHHLDLTKKEASTYKDGKYEESIKIFDEIEKQALQMADYFTNGLVKQFPEKF